MNKSLEALRERIRLARRRLLVALGGALGFFLAVGVTVMITPDSQLSIAIRDRVAFFVQHWQVWFGILLVILLLRLVALEVQVRSPIKPIQVMDDPAQSQRNGHSSWFPEKATGRIWELLEDLGKTESKTPHIIRIWLATGSTILKQEYLNQFLEGLQTTARFDIRILMMDPRSEEIRKCGYEDWAREVRETCKRLTDMEKHYKNAPASIDWRTYSFRPMIRAALFNEEHLLFGFMTWQEGERAQLHHQNRSYMYITTEQTGGEYFIDFVKNWFDHEWELGYKLVPRRNS